MAWRCLWRCLAVSERAQKSDNALEAAGEPRSGVALCTSARVLAAQPRAHLRRNQLRERRSVAGRTCSVGALLDFGYCAKTFEPLIPSFRGDE